MRYLEIRRHTMRVKPGAHLSQAGVDLARNVGSEMGPFTRVLASPLPRAYETAIAMGFAVQEQVEWLSVPGRKIDEELPYPASFADYARHAVAHGAIDDFCREQAGRWLSVVRQLQDNETALLVTHGAVIEMGTIGCLLRYAAGDPVDFSEWGEALSYCEGAHLAFDFDHRGAERCNSARLLRLTPQQRQIAESTGGP